MSDGESLGRLMPNGTVIHLSTDYADYTARLRPQPKSLPAVAALPLSLWKAFGFPANSFVLEAKPQRHSRKNVPSLVGKAKPFRKENGKAAP